MTSDCCVVNPKQKKMQQHSERDLNLYSLQKCHLLMLSTKLKQLSVMKDNKTYSSWSSTNKRTQPVSTSKFLPAQKFYLWHTIAASVVQHYYNISRINTGNFLEVLWNVISHTWLFLWARILTLKSRYLLSVYYKSSVPLKMCRTQQLKAELTALILGLPASKSLLETF